MSLAGRYWIPGETEDTTIADLEAIHHVTEREMMGQIDQLLNKILIVHYPHHGEELTRVHSLFSRAKADLEEHFAKEERLVFPLTPVPPLRRPIAP